MNDKVAGSKALFLVLLTATAVLRSSAVGEVQQTAWSSVQAGSTANAETGKQAYDTARCWQCHGRTGQGGGEGPALVPDPLPLPEFIEYVRAPSGEMPAYKADTLKDSDLADIYAFLTSQ